MMSIKQKLLKQQNSMQICLKDLMNTDTAKQIAEQREQYMKNFITTFLHEWDMVDFNNGHDE